MSIVVCGSINMDLVARAPALPAPGQTLTGHAFFTAPGGKGANQAVACARLGQPTRMVGRVGADAFGAALRAGLAAEGVDVAGVAVSAGVSSGVALITVDDQAENTIVVVPGANSLVGAADLAQLERALAGARVLLLQLEVPLPAVLAAAGQARARGVTVILDPAPAAPLPAELYQAVDIITPNAGEAAALVGFAVADRASAERAAAELCARGAGAAVVTLGAQGACWRQGSETGFVPAFPVVAVDTVAAGDAFNGGLAAALAVGQALPAALRQAAACGALCATRPGAQPALPYQSDVAALLHEQH